MLGTGSGRELSESTQGASSLFRRTGCPVDGLTIMGREHLEAKNRARPPCVKQLTDGDEVSGRLRHLLAFDLEKPVVHPGARHQRRMEYRARLRDLVLMMRK